MLWNRVTALDALRDGDLLEFGMSANQIRRNKHPEGVVTYALRGIAPSPNVAIHDLAREEDGSVSLAGIPDMEHISLDALKSLLAAQYEQLPGVTFHNLPVSTHHRFSYDLPALAEALPGLHLAGVDSIHLELEAAQPPSLLENLHSLLRAAAACRLFISAAITIGNRESLEARIETLEMLRALQQESNAIQAVLVCIHHSTAADARREEEATAVDYLKTLAVARVVLDNIAHLQTDWTVMGPKVLELALRFGADDAGTIPRSQDGSKEPSHHGGESELRRIIRDAGFRPVERDALFRQSVLH
jgi:cyclic dehypoxanthinyl futalosine synthase